jgi:hypothetical protein
MRTVKLMKNEERNVPETEKPVEATLLIAFDSFLNTL